MQHRTHKGSSQRRHRTVLVTDHVSLTRVLLEDSSVPQLAHQGIPICAKANVNPLCKDVVSPVRQHRLKQLRPLRRLPTNLCAPTPSGYTQYHQLQCPLCQTTARASYDGQCDKLFLLEKDNRGAIGRDEASFRRQSFQAMMQEYWAVHAAEAGCIDDVSCVLAADSLSSDAVDDLTAAEHGQRMELVRTLWRQLRAMHFAAEALHQQSKEVRTSQVEALAAVALQRTFDLADAYDRRRVEDCQRQRELTLREAASRMQMTEAYATATSLLEIAACGWKLSASKSQEQRLVCEQADERNKFCALEARIRLLIDSEAANARQSIMKSVREATSAFVLQTVQAAMANMLVKEERIRGDRRTTFLAERETLLIRVLVGEEDRQRSQNLHAEGLARKSSLAEPHLEWLSSRTDNDIATCRLLAATGLCGDAVERACLAVCSEIAE